MNETILKPAFVLTPDLSLSSLEIPPSVKSGEKISGSLVVTNNGPVSANRVNTEFVLKNAGLQGNEIVWLGSRATDELPPGLRSKIPFHFLIPKGVSEGEYYLEITIRSAESELFPTDNTIISPPFQIIKGNLWKGENPNLQLTIDAIDTNQTSPGSPLRIFYTIMNTNSDSAGSFQVAFVLSSDLNISSGYRIREEQFYAAYGNMDDKKISEDLIPDNIPPGTYYLAGVVDYSGMIQETEETDNVFIYPEKIRVTYPDDLYSDAYANLISGYLFLKTNKYREYLGLPHLEYDDRLSEIALEHSWDMIQRSYFSHFTPEDIDPAGRAELAGYDITRYMDDGSIRTGIAENIIRISSGHAVGKAYTGFVDPTTPEEIADVMMIEWINSPEHNKNLINPTIKQIGIGASFDGEFFYATQNFF